MRRSLWALVCSMLLASAVPGSSRAAEKVDVILVLASDVSRSITDEKFVLQRRGYAEALTDKRVLHALAEGQYGQIAVTFIECWSLRSARGCRMVVDPNSRGRDGFRWKAERGTPFVSGPDCYRIRD